MHKLGKAVKTSAEGKDDVSAAVAAVLEDVEEYLVSNLVELERAGANGSNLKPWFLSSCAARLHFWALQIHSWLFVLYNVPDLLHCRTILVYCVLQGTRAVQCPLGKAANWPAACFSPPTCPSISNHKQFFGILRILCLHCIVYLQLAAVHCSARAPLTQLLSTSFNHAAYNNGGHAQQACSALLQVQSRTASLSQTGLTSS